MTTQVGAAKHIEIQSDPEAMIDRLRAMLDCAPGIVAYVDADRVYRFNNRAYLTWFGIDPSSLTGRKVADTLGPAAYESLRKHIDAALAGHQVEFESAIPYTDGVRYVQATYTPDIAPDGTVRGYVGHVQDITGQRAREAEIKEQRDLYDALLRAVSDAGTGVVLMRGGSTLEYVNEAYAEITGRTREELLAPDFDPRTLLPPGEEARLRKELGVPSGGADKPLRIRARILRPDGEVREVAVAGISIALRGGSHRISLVRDVTEEVRSRDALDAARRHLAMTEKLAALGSLVNGVAHEIRTPLTIIETNAQLLQARARQAEQTKDGSGFMEILPESANEISRAIERANGLVQSLRRFGRDRTARLEKHDLSPVVQEAVELFQAANRGRTQVVLDLHPTAAVLVDKAKFQQVVLNLLDNAADALQSSSKPIRVSTFMDGPTSVLRVEDEGVGMDVATAVRMYEPMFTTKGHGTGLGLSITKRIIEEHGASIECDSAIGRGTMFTVRLPVADAPQSA